MNTVYIFIKKSHPFRSNLCALLLVPLILISLSWPTVANPVKQRIQKKAQAAIAFVNDLKRKKNHERKLFHVVGLMKQIKPLIHAGKPLEAERILDQVLLIKKGSHAELTHYRNTERWHRITILGPKNRGGIFDPSIVHNPNNGKLWMAYSTIYGPGKYPKTKAGPYIRSSLATSSDGGRTWVFVRHLNESWSDDIRINWLTRFSGVWRAEVPRIVYTPGDSGKEWKLFVHRYFWDKSKDRLPALGWIGYSHAPSPEGPWSEEIPYFGASNKFPIGKYNKTKFTLSDIPGLKNHDYVAFSETGALYYQDKLYVCLTALKKHGPDAIILLSSDNYGKTWKFVNTLADRQDAQRLNFKHFDGADLALKDNKPVLLVSPAKPGVLHFGTLIIPFANIEKGELHRAKNRKLLPIKHIRPQMQIINHTGGGQSTYSEWRGQKVFLMPQTNFKTYPDVFNIYRKR